MPVININKFLGLHDGVPEQPGFAAKCDNLWITEHGKLSKRGGVQKLFPSVAYGLNMEVIGIFSMKDFKTNASSESELVTDALFVVSSIGKLYVKRPTSITWEEVFDHNSRSLFSDFTISDVSVEILNDIAYLSFTGVNDVGTVNEKHTINFILYQEERIGPLVNTIVWTLHASSLPKPKYTLSESFSATSSIVIAVVARTSIVTAIGNRYEFLSEPNFDSSEGFSLISVDLVDYYFDNESVIGSPTLHLDPSVTPASNITNYLDIYCTENNGTTLYKRYQGKITGDSHQIVTLGEAADPQGQVIYTQSGEIANNYNSAMSGVSCMTSNGIFWNVNSRSGNVQQSKPYQPAAWPGSFETRFSDTPIGLGAVNRYPVVFTKKGCFRIEGFIASDGTGSSRVITISDTIGAFNHEGIVKVDHLLYFLSHDGVYATDGFKVKKVSGHINKTYANLFNRYDTGIENTGAVSGVYDSINKMIIWTVKDFVLGGDHVFIGYPEINVIDKGANIAFTVMNDSLLKKAKLHYIKNSLLIGVTVVSTDYLYAIKTSTREIDPDIESSNINYYYDDGTSNNPSSIAFEYVSTPISFGNKLARKWVSRVLFTLNKLTQSFNASFGVFGVNDHTGGHTLTDIRVYNENRFLPVIKRHFPRGFLRCTHKQIGIRDAEVVLFRSDDYSTMNTTATTGTLTGVETFPTDDASSPYRHYIYFADEDYLIDHFITISGPNSIEFATARSVATGVAWKIVGVSRDEPLLIDDIALEYTPIGEGHIDYTPERGGENV